MRKNAAAKVRLEFVAHEGRQLAPAGCNLARESQPVRLHSPVEQSRFRLPTRIVRRLVWMRVRM